VPLLLLNNPTVTLPLTQGLTVTGGSALASLGTNAKPKVKKAPVVRHTKNNFFMRKKLIVKNIYQYK
jgi:hypothetical protein